ncbi:MAG: tetratricopeptide repeat protein [Phycisphaeraceae bacterium]
MLFLATSPLSAAVTEEQARQLRAAQQRYQANEDAAAAESLETMLEADPTFAEAHRLLGFVRYRMGENDAARQAFVAAMAHGRLTVDQLGRLVEIDREAGRTVAMLNTLRMLIVLDPEEPSWRRLYAYTLTSIGATDEAEAVLRELATEDTTDADARLRLANLYMEQGRSREAAAALETAYHLGERSAEVAQNLAALWAEQQNYPAALTWHDRVIAATAEPSPTMLLRRAELLLAVPEDQAAAEIAEQVIGDEDEAIRRGAHVLLARIAMRQDDDETAAAHYAQAVEAGLNDAQVLTFLGAHHFNAGRYEQAAGYLAQRAEAEPLDRQASRFLVLSYLANDQREQAGEVLRDHLEQYGMDDSSRRLLREWSR